MKPVLALILTITWLPFANASEPRAISSQAVPPALLEEPVGTTPGIIPPGIIPHGRIAENLGVRAWFSEPTDRYWHGVLGDQIEAGALVAEIGGRQYTHRLSDDLVFEDLEPRIADIDGDGTPEILAILAHRNKGASVSIYGIVGETLNILAQSDFIGRSHRWLNPAGIADFDGDGTTEIAYIETPHIGGQLVLLAWDKASGRLVEERRKSGWSTHAIGSTVLAMAITLDWNGDGVPDLLLPRQNRRDLSVVSMTGNGFEEIARYRNTDRITSRLVRTAINGQQTVVYRLSNGTIWGIPLPQ